jgi:hypothetical protein
MQNSLWKKSYASDYDACSPGRKTLPSVSSHPIEQLILHTCRRNSLEAMAQLASMRELN